MTNEEISDVFGLLSKLMDLHGENAFKAKSYASAAFNIEKIPVALNTLNAEQMLALPAIGVTLQKKIEELLSTGHLKVLDELLAKTPEGVLLLMKIKGLGPKKVSAIWHELGIESIGELKYACLENRLTLLKGFGEKIQQNVLQQIQFIESNTGYYRYADIENMAEELLSKFKKIFGEENVSVTGPWRRGDITMNSLDFVINTTAEVLKKQLPEADFLIQSDKKCVSKLEHLPEIVVYLTNSNEFLKDLFSTTATKEHLDNCKDLSSLNWSNVKSEQEVYANMGLPYIIPEMRNGTTEWEWSKKYRNDDLINVSDIKGQLHNHSTYSDGKNTLEEMAKACIASGMKYFGICDHSQVAVYAQGLSAEKVFKQHKEIDALNKKLSPFRIYKGTECDILFDGRMDYEEDVLSTFEIVVASIHSGFKMDINKATERIIKAIENPYTRILGHPTGRLLLSREGYPLDMIKIIDACASNKVAIEINANPYRLDIDWTWVYAAMEKGVLISINPDAHNMEGLEDIKYGIIAARKGGLIRQMTLNALPLEEFDKWIKKGKN